MPKRSNSIKRLFFLKNSKFLELPNAKQKGVLKSSHNFSFINQSQRIWSFFQKIQVSFTFQYQMKKKLISTTISQIKARNRFPFEKQQFLFSLISFFGWWEKQKSILKGFLGLFETDILIDLFWSLHGACLKHVQFGYSHGFMDQIIIFLVGNIGLKNKNLPRKELKQKKEINNKNVIYN